MRLPALTARLNHKINRYAERLAHVRWVLKRKLDTDTETAWEAWC